MPPRMFVPERLKHKVGEDVEVGEDVKVTAVTSHASYALYAPYAPYA